MTDEIGKVMSMECWWFVLVRDVTNPSTPASGPMFTFGTFLKLLVLEPAVAGCWGRSSCHNEDFINFDDITGVDYLAYPV